MIGQTISHFKILEKLGEGGMGVVYKAQDLKLDRHVALKFLSSQSLGTPDEKTRFVHEAKATAALDHPNICAVHEIDDAEGHTFIAMAYVDGQSLREKTESGPLKVEEVLRLATDIARGLQEAHEKGIVHRDIKSANVMVTKKGQAKITDFGLAKLAGSTRVTKTGTSVGTAAYMSPEQALGESVDHRSDIWSLGVLLYEMLTGQMPFIGDHAQAVTYQIVHEDPKPITELRGELPIELEWIVDKAMTKQATDRYENVGAMLSDLKTFEDGLNEVQPSTLSGRRSIAVLAFANMSADDEQEYFCDGIAEDIINALTQVEGLHVAARTSSFAFKGRNEDVREIGKKLAVRTLLEGSVRKSGNQLRITAQLLNTGDGCHLWSERYDRELKDVFRIQDEIAQRIVQELRIKLTDKEKRALGKVATQDVEAYDLYLRGRKYLHAVHGENLNYAIEMYQRAIERDPDYALAYAGLADCYTSQYTYGMRENVNNAIDDALKASEKSLKLDPELAEAYSARGNAVSLGGRYEEAERDFEKALKLNPKLFEAYYFFARTCFRQGKFERAIELFQKASHADPADFQAPTLLAQTYRAVGRDDEGAELSRQVLRLIEERLEHTPEDLRARLMGAQALVDLGEKERALQWVQPATRADDPASLYQAACVYAKLGRTEQALELLERAVRSGLAFTRWMENDPDLDSLRTHPRYQALSRRSD